MDSEWIIKNRQRTSGICPIDCQWSEWYKEGECSRSCKSGKQIFMRKEEVKSKNGGKSCFGSDTKIETCNNHDCMEPGK